MPGSEVAEKIDDQNNPTYPGVPVAPASLECGDGGLPSPTGVERMVGPSRDSSRPPSQPNLPHVPEDPSSAFLRGAEVSLVSEQQADDIDAMNAQKEEDADFHALGVQWVKLLADLARVTGSSRANLQGEFARLGQSLLRCPALKGGPGYIFLSLEQVIVMIGAARTLADNLGPAMRVDVETLAGAFGRWTSGPSLPPALKIATAPKAPTPKPPAAPKPPSAPKPPAAPKPPPAPRLPASSPTNPGTPEAKKGKGRPALTAAQVAERERQKLDAQALKQAEREAREADRALERERKELERRLAALDKHKAQKK